MITISGQTVTDELDPNNQPLGNWQTTVTRAPIDERPVLVHPEPEIISGYQIGQAFGAHWGN